MSMHILVSFTAMKLFLSVELLWLKLHLTRRGLFFTSILDLELRKKLVKCYIWSIALYGAETGRFGP
jgi:hypothetical protein